MFGFLKKWKESAAEYKLLQDELTIIFAKQGVNFMHLHPEITKCLLGLAKSEGSENAVEILNNLTEKIASQSPSLSQSAQTEALINSCRAINQMSK